MVVVPTFRDLHIVVPRVRRVSWKLVWRRPYFLFAGPNLSEFTRES